MSRLFGFLSVVIVMAIGMYIYSKQATSSSAAAGANNPQAAINITGVRSDLMSIAQAERRYMTSEGKYASFEDTGLGELHYRCPAASPLYLRGPGQFRRLSRSCDPLRRQHLWHSRPAFGRRKHGVPDIRVGHWADMVGVVVPQHCEGLT